MSPKSNGKSKKVPSKKSKSRTSAQSDRSVKKKWYQKTAWILLLLLFFFPLGLFLMIRYTKWNKLVKTVLGVFSGFWFISLIYAMTLPTPEQISLSADTSQMYDVNTEVEITLKTTPEDCMIPESAFTVSDGELSFKDDKITFTSSSEGKFDIYAKYSGVTSNKITLKFEDVEKKLEEEAERIAAEQAEAEQIAAEQAEAERIAAEQAEAERVAAEQAEAVRLAQEQAEAERAAAEQAEAARIAQEQAQAESAAAQPQNPGNNFNAYDNPEQQQTTSSYVLNTNTMKFHYPTCRDVKKIAPHNYSTYDGTRDGAIGQGYSPCGHCKP